MTALLFVRLLVIGSPTNPNFQANPPPSFRYTFFIEEEMDPVEHQEVKLIYQRRVQFNGPLRHSIEVEKGTTLIK